MIGFMSEITDEVGFARWNQITIYISDALQIVFVSPLALTI